MPLRRGAPAGEEEKGKYLIDRFWVLEGGIKEKNGFLIRMVKSFVFKESALVVFQCVVFCEWPLNTACAVEHPIVLNARDVTRLPMAEFFENLENVLRGCPVFEEIRATPCAGDESENVKIR